MTGVFWPSGEIPPTTYPLRFCATAGSAMLADFQPIAAAAAFMSSFPATGTTPRANWPSWVIIRVLYTWPGSRPSLAAASAPKPAPSSCS
ncbi:hypothetical protein A5N15_06030 [Rothia kristinae]|uniref:Uncharacterized protein n=1 Tax=Rothia kristinae TaxID=37923 RepID=A0A657IUT9_9MICC|nr:hypothetical protein A5N15_06030 [Rothia kristinae]